MKLLLAEDEKELSKALVTLLKLSNYTVDQAFNGEEALDYIETSTYDCIILDIMMPYIDGIEVLKRIRAKKITTPVIMLTAKYKTEDKCLGLDLGADDYISKPFNSKELLSRIKAVTRRNGTIKDEVISFEDISLNVSSATISGNDKEVKLNNKEYQLMNMFISYPKRLFSLDYIIDNVWGQDFCAELSTVWVYISNLRKKIKEVSNTVDIKSSRSIGYCLDKINDSQN